MKAVAWAVFQKGSLNNYKSEKSRWVWMYEGKGSGR